MNDEYLWVILLCWTVAAFLVIGGLIWGISSIALRIRDKWRASVWDTAARMLGENRREVENYVAAQHMDLIELEEYKARPYEIPDLERQNQLTKEEALNGMLIQGAEALRLAVEVKAQRVELAWYATELARLEKLRARYWKHIKSERQAQKELTSGQEEDPRSIHQELAASGEGSQDEGEQGAAQG